MSPAALQAAATAYFVWGAVCGAAVAAALFGLAALLRQRRDNAALAALADRDVASGRWG